MKDMNVSKKLFVSFTFVIVLSTLIGVIGIIGMFFLNRSSTTLYEKNLIAIEAMGNIREVFNTERIDLRNLLLSQDDSEELKHIIDHFPAYKETILENFAFYDTTIVDESAETAYYTARKIYLGAYNDGKEKMLTYLIEGKTDEAYTTLTELGAYIDPILDGLNESAIINNEWAEETDRNGSKLFMILLVVLIVIIIIVAIVSVTLAMHVSRSISKPLIEVSKVVEALSHGNFDTLITYESKDELGAISQALRVMVSKVNTYIQDIQLGVDAIVRKNLRAQPSVKFEGIFIKLKDSLIAVMVNEDTLIKQLQKVSNHISLMADHLATGAQSLTDGTNNEAGSVAELSATISNITEHVNTTAKVSETASMDAKNVGKKSMESAEQMRQMTEAMERINQASGQIETIIKSIESIASQTNLLSLNAAIEAARVGEAGKGFAVVAEEIRELAKESARAAANTRNLIETTIAEVKNGDKIANDTAEVLKEVNEGIDGVIHAIDEVKDFALMQADQMNQINYAIEQISSVIESVSLTAEESAKTSEELSAQANTLQDITTSFILMD